MAIFRSRYKNFTQNVRSSSRQFHPITGVEIGTTPAIRAEFGILGDETTIINPENGQPVAVADIHGGFFDSEAARDQYGWSPEEHDTVLAVLRRTARERPDLCEEVVPVHVPAERPWVNYDDTAYNKIAEIAQLTDNIGNAIRYETENLNRAAVLADLHNALNDLPDEQGVDELAKAQPVEQIPADALQSPGPAVGTLNVGRSKKGIATTDTGIVKDTPGLTLNNPATIRLG